MDLRIPLALVNKVLEETQDPVLLQRRDESPFKRAVIVDGTKLTLDTVKVLKNELSGKDTDLANSVLFLYSLRKNKKNLKVHNMESLRPAILSYLNVDKIDGYLYQQGDHRAVAPMLVVNVTGNKTFLRGRTIQYIPHVAVEMAHSSLSQQDARTRSVSFSIRTIEVIAETLGIECRVLHTKATKTEDAFAYDFECKDGIPVDELFTHFSLFKETEELKQKYQQQIERFLRFLPMFGKQFRVKGYSISSSYWYGQSGSLMLTEGKPGRCIMNTIPAVCYSDETEGKPRRSRHRYDDYDDTGYDDDDKFSSVEDLAVPLSEVTLNDLQADIDVLYDGEGVKALAPLHPTLSVFHLDRYSNFTVHVNNLLPYKYKDDIDKMLILPENVKELVNMLVQETDGSEAEDVIEDKSQSTIITCIGDPGVGKTLTAEVIAEACKKPLYKVPADQLGANAEELERTLTTILRRAERWDCVLMIDEANAYVHARGADIEQNAIVGVFLRRLEYFKGILFLTTNQTNDEGGFDIDDAILSRSAAVIRMTIPTGELAFRIWKVQAKLFNSSLPDDLVNKLVQTYKISGRSIRNLLKLSLRWSRNKNEELKFEHFKECASFIPFTAKEKIKHD